MMQRLCRLASLLLALALLGAPGARAQNDELMDELMGDPQENGSYYPVDAGYAEFLAESRGQVRFPRVTDSVRYFIDAQTENHSANFRSSQLGYTNIKFGPILQATMQGSDVGTAFGRVTKASSPDAADGLLVVFWLTDFDIRNFRAFIQLTVAVRKDGQEIMLRPYYGVGRALVPKKRGSSYAMKEAVRNSTKDALDRIILTLVDDMKRALKP